jgi:acetylornithine deacetylase/succinyl-diaminopimelate desuccinylase-like protein
MGKEDLLSAQELLAKFVEQESHTPRGQDRMADLIVEEMRVRALNALKVPYPVGAALPPELGPDDPRPSNVICYIGKRPSDKVRRNTLIEVHYDTVPPHPEYDRRKIDPYAIRVVDESQPHLLGGLGTGDMKGPLVAMILAAERLQKNLQEDCGVTLLAVSNEEMRSEGIHAAQGSDLLRDVTEAISLEIQVGSKIGQDPVMLAGRPGRVELQIDIEGLNSHTGKAFQQRRKGLKSLYACDALSHALQEAWNMRLSEDERDFPNSPLGNLRRSFFAAYQNWFVAPEKRRLLMPRGQMVPTFGELKAPPGMNVANHAMFHVDVLYSNPRMTPERIRDGVWNHLRKLLPNVAINVMFDQKRTTPPTGPWREDVPAQPFLQDVYGIAKRVHPRGKKLGITHGEPTADEALFSLRKHIPTVGITPDMAFEHTADEVLDVRSLTDWQMPVIEQVVNRPFAA